MKRLTRRGRWWWWWWYWGAWQVSRPLVAKQRKISNGKTRLEANVELALCIIATKLMKAATAAATEAEAVSNLSSNSNFNFSYSLSFSFTRLCIYVGIILVRKAPKIPRSQRELTHLMAALASGDYSNDSNCNCHSSNNFCCWSVGQLIYAEV